jgi:hypothetical protein
VWIAAARDVVFELSRSIDIHSASTSKSGEQAVGGAIKGHIELGEQVTWEARHFGLNFQMTSRITEMNRPTRFVDEQVDGPFKQPESRLGSKSEEVPALHGMTYRSGRGARHCRLLVRSAGSALLGIGVSGHTAARPEEGWRDSALIDDDLLGRLVW